MLGFGSWLGRARRLRLRLRGLATEARRYGERRDWPQRHRDTEKRKTRTKIKTETRTEGKTTTNTRWPLLEDSLGSGGVGEALGGFLDCGVDFYQAVYFG
jgi:hypothetical protein